MLIRTEGDERFLVTQPAHAWLSGRLARAWGNEQVGQVTPREETCLAADLHDIGWLEWELKPTFNAETGLPHTFLQLPTRVHLSVWGRASELAWTFGRYAALLVSMHGTGLYGFHDYSRDTEDEARDARAFVERETRFQERTIAEMAASEAFAPHITPEALARNRRLVGVWDSMSLAICGGLAKPWTVRNTPTATAPLEMTLTRDGDRVIVDPWPFSVERLVVEFEGRLLGGPYGGEEEMRAALAVAPWKSFSHTLTPG